MTFDEIMADFKSKYQLAKTYKISHNTVANWQRLGYIPLQSQGIIRLRSGKKFDITPTPELGDFND